MVEPGPEVHVSMTEPTALFPLKSPVNTYGFNQIVLILYLHYNLSHLSYANMDVSTPHSINSSFKASFINSLALPNAEAGPHPAHNGNRGLHKYQMHLHI
jgi:hypothetical protein